MKKDKPVIADEELKQVSGGTEETYECIYPWKNLPSCLMFCQYGKDKKCDNGILHSTIEE